MLRSDAYTISPAATVEAAVEKVPLVKLDDAHYKLVDKMERLVPREPSLKQVCGVLNPDFVHGCHLASRALAYCSAHWMTGGTLSPPSPTAVLWLSCLLLFNVDRAIKTIIPDDQNMCSLP